MKNSYFITNRKRLKKSIKNNSVAILYSGYLINKSADEEYDFQVNLNFYYLTNIDQDNSFLIMGKKDGQYFETLIIDPFDPNKEAWTGKRLTKEEASEISGVSEVLDDININDYLDSLGLNRVYLDLEDQGQDFINYNNFGLTFRDCIEDTYEVLDIYPAILDLRRIKQKYELNFLKESIKVTNKGLKNVMRKLKDGKYEYQAEEDFANIVKYNGNKRFSFKTIAASGKNSTTLHYGTNMDQMHDGDVILFDLGCKTHEYCSDISRTYPVNGKFTERQKTIYNIVLRTNEHCIEYAKAGMTFKELNEEARRCLFEGLKEIGKIQTPDELTQYYFHGVSHSLGLDCHDPVSDRVIREGMVITIEPGLYIKDEKIGVRIEDDIVINKNGNIVLSKDIAKHIEDIEKFMAK